MFATLAPFQPILDALGPVFALIVLGFALRRVDFPGAAFWTPAERLAYYLLLPALLVRELASADLSSFAVAHVALVLVTTIVLMTLLALRLRRWLGSDGPAFGSSYQGVIRLNTYVGLAACAPLYGRPGLALAALALAVMVPLVNVLCVSIISHAHGLARPTHLFAAVLRNPLIIACLLGIALNRSDIGLPPGTRGPLDILARAALPLGLLTMGAGLQIAAVRGRSGAIALGCVLKLLVAPLLGWTLAALSGLPPLETAVVVLFAALPGAPSSYILARQMGGDAPLAAAVVTVQTLLSMLTLPLLAALSHAP
ncbi:AEC family transporter [Plasticicumulans acidivorans]|uniref:AEC family transporter n=1 Tax=Plasticicumulans acidivorans TaxID=886464 RepID=A0A317MVV6_9GAMM|nr:AEC family transporter [Plasticicumulans acidivorans]PWV61599.1 hypothetical protein C7443_10527 [Plasticicumulans acidivorans]